MRLTFQSLTKCSLPSDENLLLERSGSLVYLQGGFHLSVEKVIALHDYKRTTFYSNHKKNQTNRASLALVFPRFDKLHASLLLVFIGSPVSFVIGQSNCVLVLRHTLSSSLNSEKSQWLSVIRTYGKFRLLAPWVNTCSTSMENIL